MDDLSNEDMAESAAVAGDELDAGWYERHGLDAEHNEFIAGKGYRSLGELINAYRELERYQGKSIAVPRANAREEDWARVWDRLGRPQAPDGYHFEGFDGVGDDDRATIEWFREAAHRLGLTQRQAEGLLTSFASRNQELGQAAGEQRKREAAAALNALQREWGAETDGHIECARRAVRSLELDDRELASLSRALGSDAELLRVLARLGPKFGEDVQIGRGRDPLALSAGQARQRIDAIYHDREHPYHDGDHPAHGAAVQEMLRLNEVVHGEG